MSNVHLKIVQAGWGNYTGSLGSVEFVDGVSTREATQNEVDHLSAILQVETVDGEQVGAQVRLIGGATTPAPVAGAPVTQTDEEKVEEFTQEKPKPAQLPPGEKTYTLADLETIADADGIAGLRLIATPRGIKGRQIVELINEILADQAERQGKSKDDIEQPSTEHELNRLEHPIHEDARRENFDFVDEEHEPELVHQRKVPQPNVPGKDMAPVDPNAVATTPAGDPVDGVKRDAPEFDPNWAPVSKEQTAADIARKDLATRDDAIKATIQTTEHNGVSDNDLTTKIRAEDSHDDLNHADDDTAGKPKIDDARKADLAAQDA